MKPHLTQSHFITFQSDQLIGDAEAREKTPPPSKTDTVSDHCDESLHIMKQPHDMTWWENTLQTHYGSAIHVLSPCTSLASGLMYSLVNPSF